MSNIITYPTNPTQGQEFTVGQTIKVWDGEKWVNKSFGNHELRLQGLEAHEASNTNPHNVTKDQVGLSNVDNVSADNLRDRSTHTGTQSLSTISDAGSAASKDVGVSNGVASLDGSGKVPDNESQVSSVSGKKGDVELNLSDIKANGGTADNVIKAQLIGQGLSGNYGFFEEGFNYTVEGDIGIDADGNSWIYVGAGAPNKVVSAGTVPSVDAGYEQVMFNSASSMTDSITGNVQTTLTELKNGKVSAPFKTVADMKAAAFLSTLPEFTRVEWQGYYTQSDGGSNWGVLRFGSHTEDGGSIFSIDANTYIEANVKHKVYVKKWGVRVGDSRTYEEENSLAIERAINSYASGGTLMFPIGSTVVKRAVQPVRGWEIKGASRKGSKLKRYDTTPEILDGESTTCIVYVKDTWLDVSRISIEGDLSSQDVDGIAFNNANPPSQLNFTSIDIFGCDWGIRERAGLFMATFRNVNVASCNRGFMFNSQFGKTSLHFTSCYASSINYQPWQFVQTTYSSLSNCGADVVNTLSKDTELGVYDFFICSMTLDNCGTENNNFGNGIVRAKSSKLVINGLTSFGWGTEYLPDYSSNPNYSLGPIQCDGEWNALVISQPRIEANQPIDHAGVGDVANLLAFNSTDTLRNEPMVNFTLSTSIDDNAIKGQGDIDKYVLTSEGIRDALKYSVTQRKITGTGSTITIPVKSQTGANRKHMIKISSISGGFNGTVTRGFECSLAFVSLNSISDLSSWGTHNATVTSSSMNIIISLPWTTNDPIIAVELVISEQKELLELGNITIS